MECRCDYLKDEVCRASISSMEPALFDYDEYCNSEEHCNCPVLLAHTLRRSYEGLRRAV